MVPESGSLRQMFHEVVRNCYTEGIGIDDVEVSAYVADVLTEFSSAEKVYCIRNLQGRTLTTVDEMMAASDPVFGLAYSFDREREVRKHIGDYALFVAGLFPEAAHPGRFARKEGLLELVRAGKESYHIVSQFNLFEYANEAPLFEKLTEQFEGCIYGLNLVRVELDRRRKSIASPEEPRLLM
jgi:hypothetical protein